MRERETQAWEVCTTPRASSFCNLFNFVKPQSCLTLRPRAAVRSPGAGGAPGRVPAAPRGLRAPGGGSAGGAPGTGSKALTLLCAGGVVVLPPSISLGCLKSCFEARPGISQCLEEPQPQPRWAFWKWWGRHRNCQRSASEKPSHAKTSTGQLWLRCRIFN